MKLSGGIDFGKTGERTVFLELGWKNIKVVENNKAARIAASVPSNLLTYRQYSLPFVDKKRQREIVKEEIADSLPFPLEEATWDFCSTPKGNISVVIARNDMLKSRIESLTKPFDSLDAEPFALLRTANYCGIKDALIIDFGAGKTVFCGIRDGFIESVKVLQSGGEYITQSIMENRKIDFQEAEELKKKEGINLTEARAAIIRILRTANLPSPFPYPLVIISGQGAQMVGLKEILENNLKVQVTTFSLPDKISSYTHHIAFGMALKGKDNEPGINLMEEKKSTGNQARIWITLIAVPLILAAVNLKLVESNQTRVIRNYRNEMKNLITKELPDIKKIVSPLNQLKSKISEFQSKETNNDTDILSMLDEISKVTAGKDIKIFEIDVNENSINLNGETSSYQEVEVMRKGLLNSFKDVKLGEGKTLPSKRITFTMTVSLKENYE